MYLTKTELCQRIMSAHAQAERKGLGESELMAFFYQYFKRHMTDEHEITGIVHYLPVYVVRAMEFLRTSQDPFFVHHRERYLKAVKGKEIPCLTEIAYGGVYRALTVGSVASIMAEATGSDGEKNELVRQAIQNYCLAQDIVLQQSWYNFLRAVGSEMFRLIDLEEIINAHSGKFGDTDLRTFAGGGRLMVSFSRRHEGTTRIMVSQEESPNDVVLPYFESSICFIGEDSKKGRENARWGIQSCHCDFPEALTMITEVTTKWQEAGDSVNQIFRPDRNVSIM